MSPRAWSPIAATLSVILLQTACTEGPENVPAETSVVSVRDSAGVQIVENAVTAWPPAEVWQIPDTPDVAIGVASGDPDYELFQVRGAVGTPDGGVVIAEFGVRLRYYDAAGRHIRTVSRQGEGPGEAQLFSGLAPYRGDSIVLVTEQMWGATESRTLSLVLDRESARGHGVEAWYPGGGARTDSTQTLLGGTQGAPAWLSDGSMVVRGGNLIRRRGSEGDVIWGEAPLLLLTPSGALADTIAMVRTNAYELRTVDNRWYELLLDGPESPGPRAHGQRIFRAHPDRWQVDVYEATGFDADAFTPGPTAAQSHSFRLGAPLDSTTDAVREEYIRALLALDEARYPERSDAGAYRERLESLSSYPTVPTVGALEVDADGNVWLELHAVISGDARASFRRTGLAAETEPSRWIVLDPEGRLLGSVLTPVGVEITEIGGDYLLGWRADELGVQQVVKYRVEKG